MRLLILAFLPKQLKKWKKKIEEKEKKMFMKNELKKKMEEGIIKHFHTAGNKTISERCWEFISKGMNTDNVDRADVSL